MFSSHHSHFIKIQVKLLHNKQLKVFVYVRERERKKNKSVCGDIPVWKGRPSLPRNLESCAQNDSSVSFH